MSERPILFSAPMIRALLASTKTQTRRVLKPQPAFASGVSGIVSGVGPASVAIYPEYLGGPGGHFTKARFAVGDRLWVREAWRTVKSLDHLSPAEIVKVSTEETGGPWCPIIWPAGGTRVGSDAAWQGEAAGRLRASMHLPRAFSRITLIVTAVRVERLQDISEADAAAEGCASDLKHYPDGGHIGQSARDWYASLWDQINGARSWQANPWVAAISFRTTLANINDPAVQNAARGEMREAGE